MKPLFSSLAIAIALVACTTTEIVTLPAPTEPATSDLPFGAVCTGDTQCAAGLTCKPLQLSGVCSDRMACTVACADDDACSALDPRGKCFEGCDGEQICALAERKTTELPLGSICEASSECEEGLKCLAGTGPKDECGTDRTCSLRCKEDADCSALADSAKCLPGCDGKKLCQLTALE
ncbi:MAG: hypothetical protein KIT84_05095 [Labilithrix sp.]|nr:hypothetical protein [Labilithrix sp.]MCW5810363.1 hypothetical protein [Labilithrix sp.]